MTPPSWPRRSCNPFPVMPGDVFAARPHGDSRDDATAPALHHVLRLEITVGDGLDVGVTSAALRRVVPITGGRILGPLFTGRVLPGGIDFQHVRNDTETTVLAR